MSHSWDSDRIRRFVSNGLGLNCLQTELSADNHIGEELTRSYNEHRSGFPYLAPRFKSVSMLNSAEHEISTAHKTKMLKNKDCFC